MENLFVADDGSASAWATARPHPLGYVGMVNLMLTGRSECSVLHECLGIRATHAEALKDARADAVKLVRMWVQDRVHLDDL